MNLCFANCPTFSNPCDSPVISQMYGCQFNRKKNNKNKPEVELFPRFFGSGIDLSASHHFIKTQIIKLFFLLTGLNTIWNN